jgi:hypothetical protein
VLRRFSLDEGIGRPVTPILVVTSATDLSARRGRQMRWQVTLNAERKEYEAIVTVGDASGKQIFHTVRIKVE